MTTPRLVEPCPPRTRYDEAISDVRRAMGHDIVEARRVALAWQRCGGFDRERLLAAAQLAALADSRC